MNSAERPVAAGPSHPAALPPRPRPGRDAERSKAPAGSPRVWRGAVVGRGVEVGALPPRWFPADRDKLIYLAIAAHAGPRVLEQLARLQSGAFFEDRPALLRALDSLTSTPT